MSIPTSSRSFLSLSLPDTTHTLKRQCQGLSSYILAYRTISTPPVEWVIGEEEKRTQALSCQHISFNSLVTSCYMYLIPPATDHVSAKYLASQTLDIFPERWKSRLVRFSPSCINVSSWVTQTQNFVTHPLLPRWC